MELRHQHAHSDKMTDHWSHWDQMTFMKGIMKPHKELALLDRFSWCLAYNYLRTPILCAPHCQSIHFGTWWTLWKSYCICGLLWTGQRRDDEGRKAIDIVPIKRLRLLLLSYIWLDLRKSGFHACNSKTHFLLSNNSCTCKLTNNSCKYWCWRFPGLLLLWLVSEACQMSMSGWVAFKWLYIFLTSRQPAVIHHMAGWWVWPWI